MCVYVCACGLAVGVGVVVAESGVGGQLLVGDVQRYGLGSFGLLLVEELPKCRGGQALSENAGELPASLGVVAMMAEDVDTVFHIWLWLVIYLVMVGFFLIDN